MKISDLEDKLPDRIIKFYMEGGLDELYPPQEEAVRQGFLDGNNVLVAVPTASGKTLIAELAMLKSILERGGKALYIVPLRALASEKYERFKEFHSLGVKVGISTGDFDARDEMIGRNDIIITTSEKADSLLRNQVSWIHEITVIVADEIHLIESPDRGPTLEVVISKLRYVNPKTQIIALSATVSNATELALWLDAKVVHSNWRPVELREGVYHDNHIDFVGGISRNFVPQDSVEQSSTSLAKTSFLQDRLEIPPIKGGDETAALVFNTLQGGGQCLVFEASRRNAESAAKKLSSIVKGALSEDNLKLLNNVSQEILSATETEIGERLAKYVRCGVAFHHAGLRSEHRSLVESNFRSGAIKVITCTPTLAAGLNMPARRVVIHSYRRYEVNLGNQPIPILEYKQMCGRAGRPGLDPYGESVVLAKSDREKDWLTDNYILGEPENITSKLGNESALRTHILSLISTGFANDMSTLLKFLDSTFYAYQYDVVFLEDTVMRIVDFLKVEDMIHVKDDDIVPTGLGDLVSRLYIDPLSASAIIHGLRDRIGERVYDLGLLQLVCRTPDMRLLYMRSKDYGWVDALVKSRSSEFISIPDEMGDDYEWFLGEVKTASLIHEWINENPERAITEKFGVGPGDIRSICELAEWLTHSTAEISKYLELDVTGQARELAVMVHHGASRELMELLSLRGVGRVRARKLYSAGYKTLDALRGADRKKIRAILGDKTGNRVLRQLGIMEGDVSEDGGADAYERGSSVTLTDFSE